MLEDKVLQLALKPHKYGLLANIKDDELLEDDGPFCCMPFSGHSELITRKLQSCLIQSGYNVIRLLKVEVFGRSPDEDAHSMASLVLPDVRSFKEFNEMNEGANQLMIGMARLCSHSRRRQEGGRAQKPAAFVFYKLYNNGGVVLLKSDVEKHLQEVWPKKGENNCGI
ncbi:hypothetical protein BGZ95_007326 [Linnemannia exigua]|uniref:Uncharacterized protein n=1 Tax=Linnemannia exigua TaxID=604196 RepID=A0AAD4H7W2_9FUNG|nr:hypothetical protein BGZ95_007326 [Linnemannia exigua]